MKEEMKEEELQEDIQWHPPFRGAVKIELSEYRNILEYIDEKTLTKKPLLIDLLVIKKQAKEKIDHPIGNIFKVWNVMEYKSPTDYISIDDLYKVNAYAYLLKSGADNVDEIKFEEITISFVSSKIPKKLFEHLEQERKYQITTHAKGIYYCLRDGDIPIQFIILDELDVEHTWLVALTNQITKEMLHNLVQDYKEADKNEYKEVILETVLKANYEFVKKLREEEDMSKEILEIFEPEIKEIEKKAKKEEKKEIAIKLHKMNLDLTKIAEVTGLTEEEVSIIIGKEKQLV